MSRHAPNFPPVPWQTIPPQNPAGGGGAAWGAPPSDFAAPPQPHGVQHGFAPPVSAGLSNMANMARCALVASVALR